MCYPVPAGYNLTADKLLFAAPHEREPLLVSPFTIPDILLSTERQEWKVAHWKE